MFLDIRCLQRNLLGLLLVFSILCIISCSSTIDVIVMFPSSHNLFVFFLFQDMMQFLYFYHDLPQSKHHYPWVTKIKQNGKYCQIFRLISWKVNALSRLHLLFYFQPKEKLMTFVPFLCI